MISLGFIKRACHSCRIPGDLDGCPEDFDFVKPFNFDDRPSHCKIYVSFVPLNLSRSETFYSTFTLILKQEKLALIAFPLSSFPCPISFR